MSWSYPREGTVKETVLKREFGNMPPGCEVVESALRYRTDFTALCVAKSPTRHVYWITCYHVTYYPNSDEVLCKQTTEHTEEEIEHLIKHYKSALPAKIVKKYKLLKGK